MHDEQAGVHDGGADQRNIVQHVLGFFDAGRGVHIAAEGGSDALQPVQDALAGEIFRPVEAHMFEEMGETLLIGCLVNGADIGGQIEFRPLFRFVIVADVVSHPVFQLSFPDSGIIG